MRLRRCGLILAGLEEMGNRSRDVGARGSDPGKVKDRD